MTHSLCLLNSAVELDGAFLGGVEPYQGPGLAGAGPKGQKGCKAKDPVPGSDARSGPSSKLSAGLDSQT